MFLYEVDPLFFYDFDNDGYGDFKGFIKKIDYFNFLNVDAILFPDIFNQEQTILKNAQVTIYDKYGNINDLKLLAKTLKKYKISLFVEIDIKNILNSMIIKTSIEDLKSNDISKYIERDNSYVFSKSLNWGTEKRIDAFKKIINFWSKIGVSNFVFSNFEHLYENNSKLDSKLLKQLKFFYALAKDLNEESTIGIRSIYFNNSTINNIFKKYIGAICDFYIDSSYSLIATDKNYPFDIQKKFNHKIILKKIKKIKIDSQYFSKYFISLNNNKIGRINSRWLNEENLIDESNKCLLMFVNLLPYSSVNYFGDELGQLRLKLKNKDDYHDYEYVERKRLLESKKYKTKEYELSQKYLSRINTQSFFMWNDKLNGGFSKAKTIFRKLPINYLSHNLKDEYSNINSIVNFYKNLIKISKSISDESVKINTKIKIKLRKKIFIIKITSNDDNKIIAINLSNKAIDKKINSKWKVALSSISTKEYRGKVDCLSPYEALVLIKINK